VQAERSYLAHLLDREAVSVVLFFALLGLALTPRNSAALTGLLVVYAAPLILLTLRPRAERAIDRGTRIVLSVIFAAAGVLVLTSLLAADPRVSLFGMVFQHSGSSMWLGLAATAGVLASRSRPGDPGRVSRATALFGAALGLAAVADRLGLFTGLRISDESSGILEHSISLTQVLVVCLCCAAAWALSKQGNQRIAALASMALCTAGLFSGWTRAAWVGLFVGAGICLLYVVILRGRRGSRVLGATVVLAAMLAVLATFWLVAGRSVGPQVPQWLSKASNGRTTIWTSAFAQFRQSPIIGQGTEQFTAWISWSAQPDGQTDVAGTNDPHNVVLAWMLAGGVLGLAAFSLATFAVLWVAFGVIEASGARWGPVATTAGFLAWGVAMMFGWVTPIGGFTAAIVFASLLPYHAGSVAEARSEPVRERAFGPLALGSVVIFAALCVWSWPVVLAEYGNGLRMDSGEADVSLFADAALATGDAYCAWSAVARLDSAAIEQRGNRLQLLDQVRSIGPALETAARWDANSAFALVGMVSVRHDLTGELDWPLFKRAIAAGQQADPASGVWDYLGASRGARYGQDGDAIVYAKQALRYPQGPVTRKWLVDLAESRP
jgi:O-antigen ligase